jgi:hypothetical protein
MRFFSSPFIFIIPEKYTLPASRYGCITNGKQNRTVWILYRVPVKEVNAKNGITVDVLGDKNSENKGLKAL